MAETGYSRSPRLSKGALVQLIETLGVPVPNVIAFQYNPATVSRSMTPWNPFEVSETERGQLAPQVQPFDPKETINLELELDAADGLQDDDPVVRASGIADRIAAIEQLLLAAESPLGALVNAAAALLGSGEAPERQTVPIILLVWGVGKIVPVRITSYSIEEQQFLPNLFPQRAKISLSLEVLTPDVFKCQSGPVIEIATAAYQFYRTRQRALALTHTARNLDAVRGLLPF